MRRNARTLALLTVLGLGISPALVACGSAGNGSSSDNNTVSQQPNQGNSSGSDESSVGDTDESKNSEDTTGGVNGVNCTIKNVLGDKSNDTLVEQVGVGLTKGPTAQVYSDNRGTRSGLQNLAFCQKVNVLCFVSNQTGMPSYAPGFYRFEIEGAAYYVHSAQFTNGDVLGDASGSTHKDNRVKDCK